MGLIAGIAAGAAPSAVTLDGRITVLPDKSQRNLALMWHGPPAEPPVTVQSAWQQIMEMEQALLRQKTDHDIVMWRMRLENQLASFKPYTPPSTEELEAQVDAAYAAAGARLRTLERRIERKIRVLTKSL